MGKLKKKSPNDRGVVYNENSTFTEEMNNCQVKKLDCIPSWSLKLSQNSSRIMSFDRS